MENSGVGYRAFMLFFRRLMRKFNIYPEVINMRPSTFLNISSVILSLLTKRVKSKNNARLEWIEFCGRVSRQFRFLKRISKGDYQTKPYSLQSTSGTTTTQGTVSNALMLTTTRRDIGVHQTEPYSSPSTSSTTTTFDISTANLLPYASSDIARTQGTAAMDIELPTTRDIGVQTTKRRRKRNVLEITGGGDYNVNMYKRKSPKKLSRTTRSGKIYNVYYT